MFTTYGALMKPYIWFQLPNYDGSDAGFKTLLENGTPLQSAVQLMQDLIAKKDPAKIAARVDLMIAKWKLNEPGSRLTYPAYKTLEAGWWSAMDEWAFPMLLVDLWQVTGEDRFKIIADRMILESQKEVSDGGTVWRDSNGCWFSEYAWTGMRQSDEYRVLNGHLFALQAVGMLAAVLNDSQLKSLFKCGVDATKAREAKYSIPDYWTRYELNPLTIDPTHYVIFETMQFDALEGLDGDAFFHEQAEKRRALLKKFYPLVAYNAAEGTELLLSAVGPPHPYIIDTYPLSIACSDGKSQVQYSIADPTNEHVSVDARAFLRKPINLDLNSTQCIVEATYANLRVKLYESTVSIQDPISSTGQTIDFTQSTLLDAYPDGNINVIVDPSRRTTAPSDPPSYLDTQGRLILTPKAPFNWPPERLLGFDFDADGALALGISIISGGREYFRYYPRSKIGQHNLILLSRLGIDGAESIETVDQIVIYFYTDQQPGIVHLTPNRLIRFNSPVELYGYLNDVKPIFPEE